MNIDDPNEIAGHVWQNVLDSINPLTAQAARTFYEGIEGQCATVTASGLEFAAGYDPNEDGVLWSISHTYSDGTSDMLYHGGWAPSDKDTAEREIANIIRVMNGSTVAEWRQ